MTSPAAGVLLYAIVVAASPLALAATLVVLGSGRGRLNGITFATGFVLGQAVVYVPAFLIASASVEQRGSGHPTLASILELALGALLLGSAWRVRQRRRRGIERRGPSPRTRVLLDRLTRLSPAAAFGAGAVLGFGGPKRFVITILAATTVSTSGLGAEAKLVISAVYILIATMLVSVPVAVYVVAGERGDAWIISARERLTTYREALTFTALVGFGAFFCVDGLIRLL